jgi:hypothetical protein
MNKYLLAAALALAAAPAVAQYMTYYLTAQWVDRGQRFCRYSNGTVLNVGYSICPMSIQG